MTNISSKIELSSSVAPAKSDRNLLTAAKGGGIVFAGTLFQNGSRFIIAFLMARLLGPEQLGLVNLALTVSFIAASLALLGLPSAMVRYVSLFAGRRDTAGLWGILQIGLGLAAILGILTGAVLFVLADPIAVQLFHEPRLAPLLRLISLSIPFLALINILAAATQGFKRMDYAVIGQNISRPAIRIVVLLFLFLIVGLNAQRALIAFIVAVIATFLLLLYFLSKLFPLNRPLRTGRRENREVLRFALPIYLSGLIRTFGGNIQTVLLGMFNTIADVGVFAVASQINLVGSMFHGAIATASAPVVSELYDRQEKQQMGHFYQTVTKWTFSVNLPFFLAVVLFPGPILGIFGKSFVGGATALTILTWANLVDTGTGICGTVLDMTGHTSLKLVNSFTAFVLTVGLNVLLIPRWGLAGAAVAALVAAAVLNLLSLSEVFVLLRLLPYNLSFLKPIVAGLVAAGVAVGMRLASSGDANLLYTVITIIVLLVVYAGMILVLGLSQEDRMVLTRVGRHLGALVSNRGR